MKYKGRYERLLGELPDPNSEGEISIICPFHEDKKKSASVNVHTGLYTCFACDQSHNFIGFKKAFEKEHGYAVEEPDDESVVKAIPDQIVRDLHFTLMTNQNIINVTRSRRGISLDTLKKWEIGWHERTNRIAIPIRDENGVCVNIRLYSFEEKGSQKMLSWKAGFGKARLWPLESFQHERYVILCEGEMDCLTLLDRGLNAVTSTGGAKTWKSSWSQNFVGLKVHIIYDNDQTGEEGARKAAASIAAVADEVKVVKLDLSKPGEDITDYFVNYGYSVNDLKELVKATKTFKKPLTEREVRIEGEHDWVTLGNSLMPRYREKTISVPVIVSARRDERMHFPEETMFSCNQDAGELCKKCAIHGIGEAMVRVPPDDKNLLDFVGLSTDQQNGLLRARAGIPKACKRVESGTTEAGTIEEILVTPELDTSVDGDSVHLIQRAFYVGVGLDYNTSYVLKTRPVPFHKTSKIVHHVIDAVPAHDSIESFEMSPEIYKNLKKFQAQPGRAKHKLAEIMENIQNHVTRIWDRLDLHVGMDLVWHSVLEFEFDQKIIRRGWLEAIVVGDTRTGKSEIATQLQRHYGYGEIVSGENTSYAGLVGGAIKYDDSWFVKWGRIPLNDRRMVIIDEVTGMDTEDIALMSGIRETGIADITKIESQRANARTRALWIGNVRYPKRELSDYDYGCLALEDIVGMPEDIARFDYAMAAGRNEVSSQVVNSQHLVGDKLKYDSESCSLLVLWAWSRGRDTVQFQREAVEACWRHAIEMGKQYSATMPLVMAENQRIKLARVAAAIAARLFSTDDGENLIVTEEHVDTARWFMDKMYRKESFGYFQMSEVRKNLERRRESGEEYATKILKTRHARVADYITRTRFINQKKLFDNAGLDPDEAEEFIRNLCMLHMLESRGTHGYLVTSQLRDIAERVATEDGGFDFTEGITL